MSLVCTLPQVTLTQFPVRGGEINTYSHTHARSGDTQFRIGSSKPPPGCVRAGVDSGEMQLSSTAPSEVFGPELAASLLLCVVLLCVVTPLWLHRVGRSSGTPSEAFCKTLTLLDCWAAGVLLACCLLDVVPRYRARMTETFNVMGVKLLFPVPEFFLAIGFLLVLLMEQFILTFREQTDGRSNAKEALLRGFGVPCLVSSLAIVRTVTLLFSLSLCSAFEGLAMGLGEEESELSMVLLLRKTLCTLSLAVRFNQHKLRRSAMSVCLMSFAASFYLYYMFGDYLHLRHSGPLYQPFRSTLEGLTVGVLTYIVLIDVLPHTLAYSGHRMSKVTLLLIGFAAYSLALLLKT